MAKVRSTLRTGDRPTKEMLQKVENAAKLKPNLKAMPELSEKALNEFAALARAKRKQKAFVGLRLAEEDLDAYKALGKGYTGVMADILSYAIKHPDILSKAQ
jgi:uncharacterized protein (DUF4415 family)